MRIRIATLLLLAVVGAGLWLLGEAGPDLGGLRDLDPTRPGVLGLEQGEAGGEEEREGLSPVGEWLSVQTVGPEGPARMEAYRAALAQAAALRERTRREQPDLAAATWLQVGPFAQGGRVNDIAVDPTGPVTAYAATAAGGVWKSIDGGLTWEPSWSDDLHQAIGAIAAGPDGVVYAGTGDPVPTRSFVVSQGAGVYRSADGGETWTHAGLSDSGSIGRIAVDPSDPNRVFVAATGNVLAQGGGRGLFRSTDGGRTWALVLSGPNPTSGAIDVAIDPLNPRHILAAMWDRDSKHLGGPGSSLHVSTDGGGHWREAALPGSGPNVGRIGAAFAPSDPDRAYAIVANNLAGDAVGFWTSTDGGRTWEQTGAAPSSLSLSNFGWWFGRVWVDPADPDRVFVGGVALMLSTDGGDSFRAVRLLASRQEQPPIHHHAMAWDPNRGGLVYLGTDLGMLSSAAGGAAGTWVRPSAQGWTQRFSAAGPSWTTVDPALTAGVKGPPPEPYGTTTAVIQARSEPAVGYMGTAEGSLWRTNDGGQTWVRLRDMDGHNDLPGTWVTRVVVDPTEPDRAYALFADALPVQASMHLVGTSDGGATWRDLTGNLPSAPVNDVAVLPGGRLAAATDVGVFLGRGSTWLSIGSNLSVPVLDVRFDRDSNEITAATFGHGTQRVRLP